MGSGLLRLPGIVERSSSSVAGDLWAGAPLQGSDWVPRVLILLAMAISARIWFAVGDSTGLGLGRIRESAWASADKHSARVINEIPFCFTGSIPLPQVGRLCFCNTGDSPAEADTDVVC